MCVTESLCYTPETNTTLWINYTPIKLKLKKKQWQKKKLKNKYKLVLCLVQPSCENSLTTKKDQNYMMPLIFKYILLPTVLLYIKIKN